MPRAGLAPPALDRRSLARAARPAKALRGQGTAELGPRLARSSSRAACPQALPRATACTPAPAPAFRAPRSSACKGRAPARSKFGVRSVFALRPRSVPPARSAFHPRNYIHSRRRPSELVRYRPESSPMPRSLSHSLGPKKSYPIPTPSGGARSRRTAPPWHPLYIIYIYLLDNNNNNNSVECAIGHPNRPPGVSRVWPPGRGGKRPPPSPKTSLPGHP